MVSGNTIADNVAGIRTSAAAGGGLFFRNTVRSQILSNRFVGNKASMGDHARGGGLLMDSFPWGSRLATVDGNLFLDNQASADPSALHSSGGACSVIRWQDDYLFTNNVLVGNQATLGGGLVLDEVKEGTLTNNTLYDNGEIGVLVGGGAPLTLTNNIIVSHTVGISVTEGATATVRYTLWHDNDTDIGGGGTISHTQPVYGDPAFVAPSGHDYHLTIGSAARDAGDPAGVPPAPDHDRDDVARPQGMAVDIGAYEWRGYYQYLPLVAKVFDPRTG
jgi:parallel beta-helix repeat protein